MVLLQPTFHDSGLLIGFKKKIRKINSVCYLSNTRWLDYKLKIHSANAMLIRSNSKE